MVSVLLGYRHGCGRCRQQGSNCRGTSASFKLGPAPGRAPEPGRTCLGICSVPHWSLRRSKLNRKPNWLVTSLQGVGQHSRGRSTAWPGQPTSAGWPQQEGVHLIQRRFSGCALRQTGGPAAAAAILLQNGAQPCQTAASAPNLCSCSGCVTEASTCTCTTPCGSAAQRHVRRGGEAAASRGRQGVQHGSTCHEGLVIHRVLPMASAVSCPQLAG